jgi:predicted ATPase
VNKNLKSRVLAEPVLVGREHELEELQLLLDSAVEGKGNTVFVSGEAGSGKTRLTNEFLNRAKEKEIAVLSGWCLSDLAVPYFPFMQAFNTYFSAKNTQEESTLQQSRAHARVKDTEQIEDEEAEIKTWLMGPKQAGKSERLQNLTPQAWKELAVAAVTKALLSISTQKPITLFIDDLQWADSASLSLLHYISRFVSAARVLVLATFRSEELSPDAEGRPHPLLETLRLMRREDLFTEIKLSNLNQTNVAALAEKMVGGSLHSELADKLAEESHGNPLFVVESLRMLTERGSLVQDQGRWRLSIDEIGIPAKIKDIILRRVGALKPNQRRVLDLASVIGEKFNVELLGAVLGQDSLEVLETLNSVAQSSSLVVCEGDFYRFDHAKSRDALYEEISPPLKKGYHARIAEKLEAGSKDVKELPVNDLAYHYAQAGNKGKAVKYALAAGKDALARFSNAEAVEHFTCVVQDIGEDPARADERTSALEGLGDALYASSMFKEAAKTFEHLANVGTGVVRLRAFRKAMDTAFFQGDSTHLVELVKKAEEYAALDRLESARIRVNKARIFMDQHMEARALEDFEEALRVFEEEYSLWDAAWVWSPL